MKISIRLLLLATVSLTGCTAAALRHETTNVSVSIGDVYQQEVLDNLARFVDNYNAFPSFAYANQGAANVTDEGSFGAGATLTHSSSATLSLLGSRTILDSYTLTPVNDPRKLELIRCAFQRAVQSCGYGPESQKCPDCEATFNRFYTGDPTTKVKDALVGEVTSECLKDAGPWFCTGPKKCVPKGCCIPVGHYCDTYVWVPPEGREYLTRLTIAIMDYATNSALVPLTKQVTYYLDENGVPTTRKLAVGQVTAGVAITEDPISLLNTANQTEVQIDMQLQQQMRQDQAAIANLEAKNGGNLTEADKISYRHLKREVEILSGKLDYLTRQLRTGALKQQYYRPAPAPEAGAALLPFTQNLRSVGVPTGGSAP